MSRSMVSVVSVALLFFYSVLQSTQSDPQSLSPGKSVERSISGLTTHSYTIQLEADTFLFASAEQKGIDIVVRIYDPKGRLLTEVDAPTGSAGVEQISFITDTCGIYRIDISPFEQKAEPGCYTLVINRIEPAASTPEGKIDQMFSVYDRSGSPGAAVAVVKDGRIIFKKGYGEANLEYGIPITPSTVFHIASVSKQFTAYAVAALAEEGRISLDDDIHKYIPEIPDMGKMITIRHLIHHTSGLRDQWNLLVMAGWRMDDVITKHHILKLFERQKTLNFDPGAEHLYCNTGYTLMAEIIARVTEMSFPDWTEKHIFEPLGMKNTLFYDDHEKIIKNRAYSYTPDALSETGFRKQVLSYANVGATSLFTTAEDLSLWAINFEAPRIGDTHLFDLMETRGILNNGDTIAYAFGQGIGKHKGLKLIGHGGADAGYRTYLGRFPEQHAAVVVLSNLSSFSTSEMALRIADLYLADRTEKEPSKPTALQTEEVTVDPAVLQQYTGQYELQPGFILTAFIEGDRFMARATGQSAVRLYPRSATEFYIKEADVSFTFLQDESGRTDRIILHQGGEDQTGTRMKPFSAAELNLDEYSGEYTAEEITTTYTIVPSDTSLIVHHRKHESFHLHPQRKDVFNGDVWYFSTVRFRRDQNNQVDGCYVSNGRVRDLWFERR